MGQVSEATAEWDDEAEGVSLFARLARRGRQLRGEAGKPWEALASGGQQWPAVASSGRVSSLRLHVLVFVHGQASSGLSGASFLHANGAHVRAAKRKTFQLRGPPIQITCLPFLT